MIQRAPLDLDVRPLPAGFGAEVAGVDLSEPVSDALFASLYAAFLCHQLLVFRKQTFNDEQHLAFARRWGTLQRHVLNQYLQEGTPELLIITNLDKNGKPKGEHPDPGAAIWHTDGSWSSQRALSTMLYAMAIPKAGGDTLFANMYAAYDGLSAEIKDKIEGLVAVHNLDYSRSLTSAKQQMTDEQKRAAPPVEHAVVRTHPDTGRKCIYLGQHALHVVGMPIAEGRALVETLNKHASQPPYTMVYRWSLGDTVIWDNRCLMHSATEFDWRNDVRTLRRTTTVGETVGGGQLPT
ncbi:MAG: TauD/TfdA family dioxygenase [Betaproteobacteria bacterium]